MLYYERNERELETRRILEMLFYENLNEIEAEEKNGLEVSLMEYVVLNCGR